MRLISILLKITIVCLFAQQLYAADLHEIEQEISDSVITTKITAKFTKNSNLNPLKISVSTEAGKVVLSGHVKNKEAFVEALKIATATKGVRSVDTDHLEIKQVNTIFTDAYITAKVEAAILKAKVLDDESIPLVGINATTDNGVVTLSGSVPNSKAGDAILKRVSAIKGVKQIISGLKPEKDA
ncbi:osmotically inducible protein Y [Legionella adelaidensis]|uniref:Osmotically inducible protein Y n=1 Tax=Legionella adelaidensis TaxID=45056 RepID=A0A0W0R2M2_9GAMM|nr:BON domain-containing protein [Legionella adelaidensis]KTC65261.1 osmotically inducible protein Y [Legionella adelaidensis]